MKYYNFNCKFCKKRQQHYIYQESRKRGVKIRCCVCLGSKEKWMKMRTLEGKEDV